MDFVQTADRSQQISAWEQSHPGLLPYVSYPGLENVDQLNGIAGNLLFMISDINARVLKSFGSPEAWFSDDELETIRSIATKLQDIAAEKMAIMEAKTALGIRPGIYMPYEQQ